MENDKSLNISIESINTENTSEAEIQSKNKTDKTNTLIEEFKTLKVNEAKEDSEIKGNSYENETNKAESKYF